MSITLWIYLVDLISKIDCILGILFVSIIIILILTSIALIIEEDKKITILIYKFVYSKIWVLFVIMFLMISLPYQNTMYMMLGISYLNNTKIPEKVKQALELKLDDVINDLRNKNDKHN